MRTEQALREFLGEVLLRQDTMADVSGQQEASGRQDAG